MWFPSFIKELCCIILINYMPLAPQTQALYNALRLYARILACMTIKDYDMQQTEDHKIMYILVLEISNSGSINTCITNSWFATQIYAYTS